MKLVRILGITAVSVILFAGYKANLTAYLDHSPYWGVPVKIQEDAAMYVAEEHAGMVAEVEVLPAKIAKLRSQIDSLVQQEQYLYNELFKSMVRLEVDSRMLPEAIAKIGPMANMNLRDLTGTDKALDALNQYEAKLPMDSPIRSMTSGLLMNFRHVKLYKTEFLDRMWQYQAENPIVVEYTPPVYMYVTPEPQDLDGDGYADPNETKVVEVTPGSQNRTWNISEEDGKLLGMTHKLHTDIDLVQMRLVKATIEVVAKMKELDEYRALLAVNTENPALRVAETKAPVVFMFMQSKSKPYVWEGQAVRRCRIGVFMCRNVGSVKEVFDQPQKMPHAESGQPVDGFLVEIDLYPDEKSSAKAKVLHVENQALY